MSKFLAIFGNNATPLHGDPCTELVSVRCPAWIADRLRELAAEENISLADVTRACLAWSLTEYAKAYYAAAMAKHMTEKIGYQGLRSVEFTRRLHALIEEFYGKRDDEV